MSFFHQAGHAEMTIGRQVEVFLYFPGDFEFEIPPSALRTGENEIEVRVAAEWVVHRPGGARVLMEAHPLEGGAEPILTDLSYVNSRFGIAPGLLVVLVATALLAASIPAANWLGSRFAARQSMKER